MRLPWPRLHFTGGSLCRWFLIATALTGAAALLAAAAEAAEATSTGSVEVLKPIGISNTSGLRFGKLVNSGLGGTVVLPPNGAASSTGGVVLAGGGPRPASFNVTGGPNTSYTITLPAIITVSNGLLNTMTVANFADSESGVGTLDGTGNGSFTVGATLTVGIVQAIGAYSGTFSVTVDYQ